MHILFRKSHSIEYGESDVRNLRLLTYCFFAPAIYILNFESDGYSVFQDQLKSIKIYANGTALAAGTT